MDRNLDPRGQAVCKRQVAGNFILLSLAGVLFLSSAGCLRPRHPITPPTPGGPQTSIEPLRDAEQVFPAIAQLIDHADEYVHLTTWGFDDELRWSAATQFPILHSRLSPLRVAGGNPRDTVEDLNCAQGVLAGLPPGPVGGGALDPNSAIVMLRCKAAELAYKNELRPGLSPAEKNKQRGEVMVMVWHSYIDPDFRIPMTNLEDLEYLLVDKSDLITWTPAKLHDEMRRRGSGESMEVLLAFQSHYSSWRFAGAGLVPMPTGVLVLTQINDNKTEASHHQKLLETDHGAYIGGLNFLKEYWDTTDHKLNDNRRWSSGSPLGHVIPPVGIPGIEDYNGPVHDTGSVVRGAALRSVNQLFTERWTTTIINWHRETSAREGLTPYGRIKFLLDTTFLFAGPLVSYIDRLEASSFVTTPSRTPAVVPDPNFIATNPIFAQSHPARSFRGAAAPQQIRAQYDATIQNLMHSTSAFAYLENQYAEDYDIFQDLWNACLPKMANDPSMPPRAPTWCRRDPFVYLVIPYEPWGLGIGVIDPLILASSVKRETKNILWLEIKTAVNIYDRQTGLFLMTLNTPPASCNLPAPFVHFTNPDTDVDPSFLRLTDTVEMFGSVPPVTGPCPIQAHRTYALSEIITDGSFMSYVLVSSDLTTATPLPPTPPANQIKTYDDYLNNHAIYIHSKHSAFFGAGGGQPVTRFVIGSANLNPRSLGVVAGAPPPFRRMVEAEDSESALFWTPPDLSFATQVWSEHLGFTATPPISSPDWALEGWENWKLIRWGGQPSAKRRVVRLDAVQRCLRLGACP